MPVTVTSTCACQSAGRVEPRFVPGPGVGPGVAGPQQDVAGDLVTEAVEDRQDLDLADSHRAGTFRVCAVFTVFTVPRSHGSAVAVVFTATVLARRRR